MINNYGYIYKTTNLINNKFYIGQRKGKFNNNYLGSGTILKRAIRKYGKENFKVDILSFVNDKKELNKLEKIFIDKYRKILGRNNLYNMSDGGDGGSTIKFHKINCICSVCKAIRGEQKGKNSPRYNKHLTNESKKKIGLGNRGKTWSKERIINFSQKMKGKGNPMYGKRFHHTPEAKEKIGLRTRGKHITEEHKLKISLSHKGLKLSKETKLKISLSKKGNQNMKDKHHTDETKKKIKLAHLGDKWISNIKLHKSKIIHKKDLNEYLNKKWIIGRLY